MRQELDRKILAHTKEWLTEVVSRILHDPELEAMQEAANHVSIVRLGYNDHGPVHMRKVTLNALRILDMIHVSGAMPSLVHEGKGTYLDSQFAVIFAGLIHDVGMVVTRIHHEWHSLHLSEILIDKYLREVYPDTKKRRLVHGMIYEAVIGHMATDKIFSVEAGTVLVADGTDMTRGRARIARKLATSPAIGDIHRHSAEAITRVQIVKGTTRPVKISVTMTDYAGVFQVEEILMKKISASPIQKHLEVDVIVGNEAPRVYLSGTSMAH